VKRWLPTRHSGPAAARETVGEQEKEILEALRELRDTTVREVMTPRVDVVALPIPVEAQDVARAVRESGHSAFPVYDEDLDRLTGVLFVNDLFRAGWQVGGGEKQPSSLDISRRLRQPFVVPESSLVLNVLSEMRRRRQTVSVVVDEYGSVAGILTAKDLLARLVGGLQDEFDPAEQPPITRVDSKRWLIDGSCNVEKVRQELHMGIPEGEYVTLGGFLLDALGRIPLEGDRYLLDGWELKVVEMERRRVAKVVVRAPATKAAVASLDGVDHRSGELG